VEGEEEEEEEGGGRGEERDVKGKKRGNRTRKQMSEH
jgi:hypothetical protein